MSPETILILVGLPLAIMVLLGLLTLRPNLVRSRRYRPGQEWNHPPVLWTANPEALRDPGPRRAGAARGGARGHW
ncbi:MAG: aa3-type cytochrome oxidase subunit CtaJ [Pseudonocardiaceae bacterium]